MKRRSLVPPMLLVLLVLFAGACAKNEKTSVPAKPALTQHQRDSVLGQSGIPGARGVQKALAVQDSLNKRSRRADSIGGDTLR